MREEFGARLIRVKGLLQMEDTGEIVFVQGVQGVFHPPQRFREWPDDDHDEPAGVHLARPRKMTRTTLPALNTRRHAGQLFNAETRKAGMTDFVLRGGTLVFPDRAPETQDVLVQGRQDRRRCLAPGAAAPAGIPEQIAAGLHVFPGLIDAHVHFGFGEKITEYSTETVIRRAGRLHHRARLLPQQRGVRRRLRARAGATPSHARHVDYGFHFSTANELHIKELGEYVKDYGVTSFKYFMNFKGEEGRYLGLDGTDDGFFYDLLQGVRAGRQADHRLPHREHRDRQPRAPQDPGRGRQHAQGLVGVQAADHRVRSRRCAPCTWPSSSARASTSRTSPRAWRSTRSASGASAIKDVIVETCPHYLTHTEDSDLGGMGKANPPFRTKDDLEALWEALVDGTIDLVASDHNARKKVTKDKPLWLASQGFPAHRDHAAGDAVRGLPQAEAAAAAHLPAARRGARADLRPRAR